MKTSLAETLTFSQIKHRIIFATILLLMCVIALNLNVYKIRFILCTILSIAYWSFYVWQYWLKKFIEETKNEK